MDVAPVNTFLQTSKRWIGQVTLTLSSALASTFSCDFNYGFAAFEDFDATSVSVTDFEISGRAGAADTSFNVELLHHKNAGWTYHATAFVPGGNSIVNMNTDHNTEVNLASGEPFAYKRTGLSTTVDGSSTNGVIVRVTTGANGAVDDSNIRIIAE